MHRRHELADGPRLAHDRRQLRAGQGQLLHVVIREGARLACLQDQHALENAAIDDGHAEKRAERIFAGVAEVLEARMRDRIGNDDGLQLLGDETGQAFGDPHPDLSDAFRPQPLGRGEHEVRAIGLEQMIEHTSVLNRWRISVATFVRVSEGLPLRETSRLSSSIVQNEGAWSWTDSAA